MQAPRGLLFFRLSSAALVLTATAFYQSQLTSPPGDASATERWATYERYESVLRLLEANRPAAAAELLESFPDTELGIHNALLRDHFADYSPAMLYLRIGKLLAQHATAAAWGGSERQAQRKPCGAGAEASGGTVAATAYPAWSDVRRARLQLVKAGSVVVKELALLRVRPGSHQALKRGNPVLEARP